MVAGADVTRKNINDDSAYSLAVKHGARAVQTVLEKLLRTGTWHPRAAQS